MPLGSWYALMVDTVTLDRDIGQKNARAIFPAAKVIPQATSRSNRLTVHHGFAAILTDSVCVITGLKIFSLYEMSEPKDGAPQTN
jgi:hypothetical protein